MQAIQNKHEDKIYGFHKDHVAIFLMILGPSLWTIGYIFPNQHKFHPVTTNLIRGVTVTIISYIVAYYQGIDLTFGSSHNFKYQMIRNVIMVFQGIVYAWCQFYLPLPIAVTLNSTSPIFATIFDRVLNGVSINRTQAIWLTVAFLGVVLVANGEYLSYMITGVVVEGSSSFQNYLSKDPLTALLVALVMELMMVLHGYGVVITKKLKNTNSIQVNYFVGVLLILGDAILFPAAKIDQDYHNPDLYQLASALIFSGLFIALAQFAFIGALLLCHDYGMLTPFMFVSIIVGYIVSVFRYGESINGVCALGAIAIVVGIVFIVRCKDKQ